MPSRGRVLAWLLCLLTPAPALAVRPFITDDARVVGDHAAQVESWVRGDRNGLQHWLALAVGPVAPLEVSVGLVHGRQEGQYTLAAPLLQAKALVHETVPGAWWPGLALVAGAFGPGGTGPLQGEGWDAFGYLALSESLTARDGVLLHQNLGLFISDKARGRRGTPTWGLGTQIHVLGGLHAIGELFSGDPYVANSSGATQVGIRHFVSRFVQIDATVGQGVWGDERLPLWGSLGLRIASDPHLF